MKNSIGSKTNMKEDSEQIFSSIFKNTADSIIITSPDGNILDWNKGAKILYGYTKSEALKMNIFDLSPAQYKEQMKITFDEIIVGQKIRSIETKCVTKDGVMLDMGLTVTELKRNKKIYAIAIIGRDLTRYLQMEASQKEFPSQLIFAQEKTKSLIAQNIHDDLGQSLIAMKMFISIEMSRIAENDTVNRKFLENMKKQISGIIDKARDLSHKLYPPNLKYIGLPAAVGHMIASANQKNELKIKFTHRNLGIVNIESIGIIVYRIVQEALTNVIKHSNAAEVSIKMIYKQGRLSLTISDNGIGISKKRLKEGPGIGLAIIREGVKIINGTLFVDSESGIGTTIRVVIPVQEIEVNE
jgi:PAS domain S-box-containing protein